MKLNEIRAVTAGEFNLLEGVIPVHITMTLEQIIDAGKITNNVQNFILAGLINMFKEGGPYRWPRDINSYSMATSSEVIEAVKTLTDEESVEMSNWLLQQLQSPANFELNPWVNPNPIDCIGWMRWVLQRQD